MNVHLPRIRLCLLAGLAVVSPGLALARDADRAANLYSRGVHAYFAGRAGEAESLLSQALEHNDRDPRYYYFRGLARLRLGREGAARADLAAGAELEASRMHRVAVGAALQRVQGGHRLLLERYRREARSQAAAAESSVARLRATQMAARDAGAVRQPVVIPLEELLRSDGPPRALPTDEAARRAAWMRQRPAPAAGDVPDEDPFRDDTAPAESQPASTPATSPAITAPPAADDDSDNPFGDF